MRAVIVNNRRVFARIFPSEENAEGYCVDAVSLFHDVFGGMEWSDALKMVSTITDKQMVPSLKFPITVEGEEVQTIAWSPTSLHENANLLEMIIPKHLFSINSVFSSKDAKGNPMYSFDHWCVHTPVRTIPGEHELFFKLHDFVEGYMRTFERLPEEIITVSRDGPKFQSGVESALQGLLSTPLGMYTTFGNLIAAFEKLEEMYREEFQVSNTHTQKKQFYTLLILYFLHRGDFQTSSPSLLCRWTTCGDGLTFLRKSFLPRTPLKNTTFACGRLSARVNWIWSSTNSGGKRSAPR
jgi:hypothetical protein